MTRAASIRSLLQGGRDARQFSAAAWAVGDLGGSIDRGLVGTLAWGGNPVTSHSRWDLASVTKPIVGIAMLSLIESGELRLDDRVADHLPNCVGSNTATLRVRDLLTHSSGLPGSTPLYLDHPTRTGLLAAVRALPLLAPPGAAVVYSSAGFILLGLIAEAASGRPLDRLVQERVLAPVGMLDTGFGLAAELRPIAVATEDDPWRGRIVQGEVHDENAVVLERPAGHAGLFSTLADMERLGRALIDGGGALLSPAAYREMIAPRTDHLALRRAFAWQGTDAVGSPAGDLAGPNSYGHTGFTGTSLWVDPDAGRYVVLLTNRVHPTRAERGFTPLRRAVHDAAFAASAPVRV